MNEVAATTPSTSSFESGFVVPMPTLPFVKYVPPIPDGVSEIPPFRFVAEIALPFTSILPAATPNGIGSGSELDVVTL